MSRRWGTALACLLIVLGATFPSVTRAANGIVITSTAVYDVRPGEGIAIVTVNLAATNVTPDSAQGRAYYTGIGVPIPAGATSVSATSGGIALPVALAPVDEVAQVANVTFGVGVFYQQTYRFSLNFVVRDAGGDPERETWIRGSFVAMPVWAFGTEGAGGVRVEVVLPPGFEVRVPYGEMEVVKEADATRVVAGPVDPTTFVAYVSAERAGGRTRTDVEVKMESGPTRLRFHAWPDDPEWTERQARILSGGLPLLEDEIGLAYPIEGTLNVSEHAYQHLGEYAGVFVAGIDSIEMRFDADAFTALHEAAHVWFNHGLADDRWLVEGFASYYAEVVGRSLGEELVMAEVTDEVREAAFPLVSWADPGAEDLKREEYGYAASHAFAREIAELAGPEVLSAVWQAADAEELVYGAHPDEDGPERRPNPDDWRMFLDLFEDASDADFDPLWSGWLLTDAQARELEARDAARRAYRATEADLGGWLMPPTTRRHMEAWDFDDATDELRRIDALVGAHAAMLERAADLSLTPTDEVGDLLGEGIDEATAELDRQEAALGTLETAAARLAADRHPVEVIGLLGGADPAAGLEAARAAFEAGDEEGAELEADAARDLAMGAADQGRLRVAMAGGIALLLDLLAMSGLAMRRRARHRSVSAIG